MYLLDTDYVIIAQRETQPEYDRFLQRMAAHQPEEFFISIVSFHEIVLGANAFINRPDDANRVVRGYEMLERVISDFARAQVVGFDAEASSTFAALRSNKVRIGTMDLRIAASALSRDMVVLTRNLRDFSTVPGLVVEDWTS